MKEVETLNTQLNQTSSLFDDFKLAISNEVKQLKRQMQIERSNNERVKRELMKLKPVKPTRSIDKFMKDSSLVRENNVKEWIVQNLPYDSEIETILVYRGSRDGWTNLAFH
jgi:hypothetical protein